MVKNTSNMYYGKFFATFLTRKKKLAKNKET